LKFITTATAAAAIGVSRKRLDNILAREAKGLLPPGAHGRSRRVSIDTVEVVALGLLLCRDLGAPISRSLALAAKLLSLPPSAGLQVGTLGQLHFDVKTLRRTIDDAVQESIEQTPTPRRGRPRRQPA